MEARMLPMEKSVTFIGACANARLLTMWKKEVMWELTTIDANNWTVNLSQCMLSCIDLLVYLLSKIIKLFGFQYFEFEQLCATFSANVDINYRLPIKVYYRFCTLRHIRIEINHGSQNVFWVLTWIGRY
jgi:hypothetical protein